MAYRDGGPVFANISQLVDEYFNTYARRFGFLDPFFTEFCSGTTVTCPGMSQWGTVTLANQGRTPIEILRHYYPRDLELVSTDNIRGITVTYPGYPLSLGSRGDPVLRIQKFLNRIRTNYPLIPRIPREDGVFGPETQAAVRTFQQIFRLATDGVVGRNTWNRISSIFVAITKLAELTSEGVRISIGQNPPNVVLRQGSRGPHVLELQFILNTLSMYYNDIPPTIQDSVFGPSVRDAVVAFQRRFGLTPDGIVGPVTWNRLYSVYRDTKNLEVPPYVPPTDTEPAPTPTPTPDFDGTMLRVGTTGQRVRFIQEYLNTIRMTYPDIPELNVDGVFGPRTQEAVIAFQRQFMLTPDGVVGPVTWGELVKQYLIAWGNAPLSPEYPGTPLRNGSRGEDVRLIQRYLRDLHVRYPSIPAIIVDGIFGPQTQAAVVAFQRLFNLTPDGIVGPITWNAIVTQRNNIQ
jgi:peptidoglycan hydrolase-like protein with peptidoglycan-binding domain